MRARASFVVVLTALAMVASKPTWARTETSFEPFATAETSFERLVTASAAANCKFMNKAPRRAANGNLSMGRFKNKCAACNKRMFDKYCPTWVAPDFPECPKCGSTASDLTRPVTCQIGGKDVDANLCLAAQDDKPPETQRCTPPACKPATTCKSGTKPDEVSCDTCVQGGLLILGPDVTEVPPSAFGRCAALESVEMPAVTKIGDEAFIECRKLKSVDMPKADTIGSHAFYKNSALTTVNALMVTKLEGVSTFGQCSALEEIEMPLVTELKEAAFSGCGKLTSITMPKLTTIGQDALSSTGVVTIDMPGVTTLGGYAFDHCGKLQTVNLPQITTVPQYAFFACEALTSLQIPKVATIGYDAFSRAAFVTLDLPMVKTIAGYAFSGTKALKSVSMPEVTKIGDMAFYGGDYPAGLHSNGVQPPNKRALAKAAGVPWW